MPGTILIAGTSSGLGRATAKLFHARGWNVIATMRTPEQETELASLARTMITRLDVQDPTSIADAVRSGIHAFGRIDVLVNNAAFQMTRQSLEEIPDEEGERTFAVNISAMFYICKAAVKHMKPGASIINTTSINSDNPKPTLLPYATTKGAIANFTAGLAQLLAEKGIRVNSVAPGPIWTPLIPSTMPPDQVASFGQQVPMKRPGQPVEVAPVYVMLASDEASYISGARIPVTGGTPIL